AYGARLPRRKIELRFDDVLSLNVQRIVNDNGYALTFSIETGGNVCGRAGQHGRELVHRDDIIVPGEFESPGRGSARQQIVELPAHHQRPGIIQTLTRIS